jgi:hypothetical protein
MTPEEKQAREDAGFAVAVRLHGLQTTKEAGTVGQRENCPMCKAVSATDTDDCCKKKCPFAKGLGSDTCADILAKNMKDVLENDCHELYDEVPPDVRRIIASRALPLVVKKMTKKFPNFEARWKEFLAAQPA